ncbi:hypothetical protein PI125_g17322 [Phytophthora idaei]|nr:hypothetical protein PI125_g17322 [Phytophthora idaei]
MVTVEVLSPVRPSRRVIRGETMKGIAHEAVYLMLKEDKDGSTKTEGLVDASKALGESVLRRECGTDLEAVVGPRETTAGTSEETTQTASSFAVVFRLFVAAREHTILWHWHGDDGSTQQDLANLEKDGRSPRKLSPTAVLNGLRRWKNWSRSNALDGAVPTKKMKSVRTGSAAQVEKRALQTKMRRDGRAAEARQGR